MSTLKKTLTIRITDKERAKLERLANKNGYTLGEMIRQLIREKEEK